MPLPVRIRAVAALPVGSFPGFEGVLVHDRLVDLWSSEPVRDETRQLMRRRRSPVRNGRTSAGSLPPPWRLARCRPTSPAGRGTASPASNSALSGSVVRTTGPSVSPSVRNAPSRDVHATAGSEIEWRPHRAARVAMGTLSGYFATHIGRLNYCHRLYTGQSIGSGMVEGAAKNLIGRRLKQTGARWRVENVNQMAELRCLTYSDYWNLYWASPN